MQRCGISVVMLGALAMASSAARGQLYDKPDRGQPGDEMIQAYLAAEAQRLHELFLGEAKSAEEWSALRPRYKQEYLHMLGLDPMPPKGPLKATVTGTLAGEGYVVEKLHYQSRPRLYVTANLYRPAEVEKGRRLPAVLYVCGHSGMGRNGNKTAFQSHGIWFARHGYVCLVVDSLQLGEIAATHHGTYRYERWWWHSRGYVPSGVECLNGIRGIDYLVGRSDVDADRIAVTGISGGGAASFWIAAADERVKVAVPVSGMADLPSYVTHRVINGHCDCMFLYNTFAWPWTRIAALVAPRPLLFVNSDHDAIFPMDANRRIINRLKDLYSLFGASDFVDCVVSMGGHAYRKDIRQAAYRFINMHLKDDPRVVTDGEVDLPAGTGRQRKYVIEPEKLRAMATDADIPKDELNTTIDEHFVPMAKVQPPQAGGFEKWKAGLLGELRRGTFRSLPDRIPPAAKAKDGEGGSEWLQTETGIQVPLKPSAPLPDGEPARVLLVVVGPDDNKDELADPDWLGAVRKDGDAVWLLAPRGVGPTRWTRKNPPNYVERCHLLLGRTADGGRVQDIVAAARYLHARYEGKVPVHVAGHGAGAVLAAYAALLEDEISGAVLDAPLLTHTLAEAPQLLNVLRVCDVPDALGMLAPRPLEVRGGEKASLAKVAKAYTAAGAAKALVLLPTKP